MNTANLTLHDLDGIALAVPVFGAILFCPGFLLAIAGARLFNYRHGFAERCAWSVALSFACAPTFTLLLSRLVSFHWAAKSYWFIALVALLAAIAERRAHLQSFADGVRDRPTRRLVLTLALAAVVVVAELIDLEFRHKLFVSVTIVDASYRTAFVNAILNTGIPPANPLFFPGHPTPFRYYYGWYALCAACARMAALSARQTLIASSVWVVFGLTSVVALFARHFFQLRKEVRRFTLIGTLLLSVTGLDLLPVLGSHFAGNPFLGDTEWWSVDQISSWLDSILWVPNHTAALLSCATCFLLLWSIRNPGSTRRLQTPATLGLASAAAASAFTLSIYVAFGFFLLVVAFGIWRTVAFARKRGALWRLLVILAITGALCFLLLLPFLQELLASSSATGGRTGAGPAHLFSFSVRAIIDPTLITGLQVFSHLRHPMLFDQLVRLALLLPGYALELGFYALVLGLAWRQRRKLDEARRTALFFAVVGLAIVSFLRSSVSENNDFGYRAALLPCFFLLLLGADLLSGANWQPAFSPALRRAVAVLLFLGFAGTILQAISLRFFVPWQESHGNPEYAHLSMRLLPLRRAYTTLDLAPTARVQSNPVVPDYLFLANMLFTPRAMVTDAKFDCGAVYGGDPLACLPTIAAVRSLYALPGVSAAQAISTCNRFGIDYLVATSGDPAWHDPRSWVWTLPRPANPEHGAEFVNPDTPAVRIVNCSAASTVLPVPGFVEKRFP